MTPQLALFDLDGTLVDTAPDFVLAANALRAQHQLPPLPAETISRVVSNGSLAVTEVALDSHRDDSNFETQRQALLEHYARFLGERSTIYPTLDLTLKKLEATNIPWGIVTNKPVAYAKPLLDKLELTTPGRCAALVCPDHVSRAKPDPEGIHNVCNALGVSSRHCVYIGDHLRDIEAARNADAISVAVGYGYLNGENPLEWNADHFAESPEQLSSLLAELFNPNF